MANNVFGALNLKAINGSGALDQIDGSLLTQGDIALVVNDSNAYIYKLYDNDNAQESSPYIIKPVLNGTNKRWRLKSFGEAASDLTVLGKLITDIISFTGSTLTVQVGNQTLATFSRATNSVSFKKISNVEDSTMVTGLNAEFVGGKAGTLLMLSDGSIDFSAPVRGAEPTLPQHLATKNYIDEAIALLDNGSSTNFTVNNLLTASTISSKTNEDLVLKRGGTTVATFGSNGVTLSKIAAITTPGMVNGLDAEFVGGISSSAIMKKDGTVAFTGAVQGVTPTLSSHLTTKAYVDQYLGAGPSAIAREIGGTAYKNFLGINCMPSLELKAYDYQGTPNGAPPSFTFNRASTATAYGADGKLYTAAADELRHEWDALTGEYKGFLVEGAATNLATYSDDLSNAVYTKENLTVSVNSGVAPDGTNSLDKLVENTTAGVNHTTFSTHSIIAGSINCVSSYVRAGERTKGQIRFKDTTTWSTYIKCEFDLTTKTAALITYGAVENASAGIVDCGGGLFRVWASGKVDNVSTAIAMELVLLNSSGVETYTGDGASGLYAGCVQVEMGSYPTSYIPTTSAQVTRAADSLSIATSAFPFNAVEGALYVELTRLSLAHTDYPPVISLDNGTADGGNTVHVYAVPSSAALQGYVRNAYAMQADFTLGTGITAGVSARAALAYKANDIAGCTNGGTVGTDTSATLPTMTRLIMGGAWAGHIRHVAYFPRRLSNTELQLLTK